MAPAHAADADDRLGQGVARGDDDPGPPRTRRGTMAREATAAAALLVNCRRVIPWDIERLPSRNAHYSDGRMETPDPFDPFHAALEARHLSELTFAEVRRALSAPLVPLRRATGPHGGRGGVRRSRQARRLRPLLRADALPARARGRARGRPRPARPAPHPRPRLRHRHRRGRLGPGVHAAGAGRGRRSQRLGGHGGPLDLRPPRPRRPSHPRRRHDGSAAEASGRDPRRVHRERARRRGAPAAAGAPGRRGRGGLGRARRRADLPPREPVVAGMGRRRPRRRRARGRVALPPGDAEPPRPPRQGRRPRRPRADRPVALVLAE